MNDPASILLIEDEAAHAELVRRAFESGGGPFRLAVAQTLAQARAHLAGAVPDLIIADWRLPDGEGMELLAADVNRPRVPVVIMTSHGNERVAVEVMKAGALDYVVKSEIALLDMPHIAERALRQWEHITARALMEEALRQSEEKYRQLVESINEAIFVVDRDGVVTYISPVIRLHSEYDPAEIVGRSFSEFIHPDDLPGMIERFQQVLSGVIAPSEYRLRTRSGDYRWVRTSSRPVFGGDAVLEVRGVLTDVTDRKRAEDAVRTLNEQLEQRVAERTAQLAAANARLTELDRLKSKFVADVSHELRNPVGNLMLYVDLLEHGPGEKRVHYLGTLRKQADRLAQLTNDILDLSRLEREAATAVFAPVDLNVLVGQVVAAHRPRAEAAGLALMFEPDLDLPPVMGAANQLLQVITNLVANAISYTPSGVVRVETRQLDGRAHFQVSDTGIGIDLADRPHLFDRFYRGKQAVELGIPGTGLGLGIVKEILDLHRGMIEVDSRVGAGTTFKVWLSLAA